MGGESLPGMGWLEPSGGRPEFVSTGREGIALSASGILTRSRFVIPVTPAQSAARQAAEGGYARLAFAVRSAMIRKVIEARRTKAST